MEIEEGWLAPRQAIDFFEGKISKATFYRYVRDKKIMVKRTGGRTFFSKDSLEKILDSLEEIPEVVLEDDKQESQDSTKKNDSEKIEEVKKEKGFNIKEKLLGAIRNEAYESGKKEGMLLLATEKEKLGKENSELQKNNAVLGIEKDFLVKALKSEKIQKRIAIGCVILWVIGWGIYYFRREISMLF